MANYRRTNFYLRRTLGWLIKKQRETLDSKQTQMKWYQITFLALPTGPKALNGNFKGRAPTKDARWGPKLLTDELIASDDRWKESFYELLGHSGTWDLDHQAWHFLLLDLTNALNFDRWTPCRHRQTIEGKFCYFTQTSERNNRCQCVGWPCHTWQWDSWVYKKPLWPVNGHSITLTFVVT